MNRSTKNTLLRTAVFVSFLGPLTCSGVHDVELRCEEAVAHLARCCPDFKLTSLDCRVTTSCGGSSRTRPQVGLDQSACILDLSCQDLNMSRDGKESTCSRAIQAMPDMNGMLMLCP